MKDETMNEEEAKTKPQYEAEDIGCRCTEDGIESEWEWDSRTGCYVCSGCNAVQ